MLPGYDLPPAAAKQPNQSESRLCAPERGYDPYDVASRPSDVWPMLTTCIRSLALSS